MNIILHVFAKGVVIFTSLSTATKIGSQLLCSTACNINPDYFFFLGISQKDRQTLIENVDVIYHCAASIRFDDPLYKAILVNVRSTRDVVKLALEAKHVKAFIHVSTAYCNADRKLVEEKLYPSHGNWREAIALAEEGDRNLMDYLTPKYIQPHYNTYTYAKSLAEHVVNDLCQGKLPTAIVRPTIGKLLVYPDHHR